MYQLAIGVGRPSASRAFLRLQFSHRTAYKHRRFAVDMSNAIGKLIKKKKEKKEDKKEKKKSKKSAKADSDSDDGGAARQKMLQRHDMDRELALSDFEPVRTIGTAFSIAIALLFVLMKKCSGSR